MDQNRSSEESEGTVIQIWEVWTDWTMSRTFLGAACVHTGILAPDLTPIRL